MAAFKSALEELHIEIFEQIKKQSKDAVGGLTELTRTFSNWIAETKVAQKVLMSFLDGIGFSIPAGLNFKKLLNEIDVDLFVDKFRSAGSALKDLGSAIVQVKDVIEAPLEFLIEHMETFASITFWGWIIDKGLAVPAALLRLGEAFLSLGKSVKFLLGLNLTSITAFFSSIIATLSSPVLWGAAGIAGFGVLLTKKILELKEAKDKYKVAQKEEEEFLEQQAKADKSLEVDVQVNMNTGFERLPEAWTKASDELRNKANATVEALRKTFRDNVGKAIDEVIAKFPEMSAELEKLKTNLSHADMSKITKALQSDKEVFNSLSEPLKHVIEQLLNMEVVASQAKGNVSELITAWKRLQEKVADNDVLKSNSNIFSLKISASINDIIKELPDNIEKLKNFLDNNDLQLPVNISLDKANKKLQELSNTLSKKFNIPIEIVNSAIFSQLHKLAETGNKTAQALRNGWQVAGNSLDTFLQNAQEAIQYLNVSPAKFVPALNSLYKNIQKVDPLTGKLTEQFKKAHDTLKQWANVTFDQLSQRIQRLRKAVEGGFIDKSALEKEAKSALQQIKVQVVTELEPLKESFKSKSAYYSTVASEVYNKAFEIGGETFADALRKELQGYYDQSGASIGRAFVEQAQKGLANISSSIKINGIEMLNKGNQSQSLNFQNLGSVVSDAVKPFVSKLEQITNLSSSTFQNATVNFGERASGATEKLRASLESNSSVISKANEAVLSLVNSIGNGEYISRDKPSLQLKDYSSEFAQVLKEFQNVSVGLSNLQSLSQNNINAINNLITSVSSVNSAVLSLENSLKSLKSGNNYDIDIHQQGFVIQKNSDADLLARNTVSALRSGIGNGGV